MMEYADSSVYFPFTFTQQDIDNVLYGYIRTPEKTNNGFALSGIYINAPNSGKHAQVTLHDWLKGRAGWTFE